MRHLSWVLRIARVINKSTHDATRRAARRRYRCDRCGNQAEGKGGDYKSKVGAGGHTPRAGGASAALARIRWPGIGGQLLQV